MSLIARLYLTNPMAQAFALRRAVQWFALRQPPKRGMALMRRWAARSVRLFPGTAEPVQAAANRLMGGAQADVRRLAEQVTIDQYDFEVSALYVKRLSLQGLKALGNSMRLDGEVALREALARPGPMMLAGFHFGNLMALTACLRLQIPRERRLQILMHRDAPAAFLRESLKVIADSGYVIDLVDIENRQGLREFVRGLRRDNPVCLLFTDLHGRFGRAVECDFFGKRARFAAGGVKLAVDSGIPIVTSYTVGTPFRDPMRVIFQPVQIGPRTTLPEVMQQLADQLEQAITSHPSDWHFWSEVPSFLMPTPLMTDRQSSAATEAAHVI